MNTIEVNVGLVTAPELAKLLRVTPKTVLNWARDGKIPVAYRLGRVIRFDLHAVMEALQANNGRLD